MNKLLNTLFVIAIFLGIGAACSAQPVQAEHLEQAPAAAGYESLLGKSLNDGEVTEFIASNYCSQASRDYICGPTGIALEIDLDQKVETVYLFPGRTAAFAASQGELPYGMQWEDTRAVVEEKLGEAPADVYINQAGLPMEIGIPENISLWAVYPERGITVVYNTLSAENTGATIHAVLLAK